MRKNLKSLLRQEKDGSAIDYPPYPYTFQEDSVALIDKIKEIKKLIEDFDGSSEF